MSLNSYDQACVDPNRINSSYDFAFDFEIYMYEKIIIIKMNLCFFYLIVP